MMKAALISPNETVYTFTYNPDGTKNYIPLGERIAEVTTSPFDVSSPLFWVSCADNVTSEQWYYDKNSQQCVEIPPYPTPPTGAK